MMHLPELLSWSNLIDREGRGKEGKGPFSTGSERDDYFG